MAESGSERAGERNAGLPSGLYHFARVHFISALHGSGVGNLFNQYVKRMTAPPVVWGPLC